MRNGSTYVLMVVTVLVWGGTYVAGRTLDPALNNIVTSFVRMVIAFAVLLVLCKTSGVKLLPIGKRLLILQILLGLFGVFLYTVFFHKGIQTVEGGRASVIINTNPIIIAVVAALFLGEKLTPLKTAGVILAAVGAGYVVSHGHLSEFFSGRITLGDIYMFIASLSWAAFALFGKVALWYGMRPLASITWSVFFGMLFLLPASIITGDMGQIPGYALNDWLSISYLGVFSTVAGFVFYYKIIRKVGATRAGVICSAIPVSAIVMTSLFLGEAVTASLVIGAAITVAGIFLVNFSPPDKNNTDN